MTELVNNLRQNIENLKEILPALEKGEGFRLSRLPQDLDKLDQYLSEYDYEKELLKVEFDNIKRVANNISEGLFEAGRSMLLDTRDEHNNMSATGDYIYSDVNSTYAHNAPSILKKVSNKKKADQDSVEVNCYKRICETVMPIADLLKDAKTKIVKKKSAALEKEEGEKARFMKILNHKDVKMTLEILDKLTTQMRTELQEKNRMHLSASKNKIQKLVEQEMTYKDIMKELERDPASYFLAGRIFETTSYRSVPKIKPEEEVKATIKKLADDDANLVVDEYRLRVTNKLAPIIAGKDCLEKITMNGYKTHYGKVESVLDLEFKDDSSFSLDSGAEHSYSKYGKPFMRFPSRFKNVMLAGAEPMASPSEERMHEVFLAENEKPESKRGRRP